jgi:CHASE3 domain sensor protein
MRSDVQRRAVLVGACLLALLVVVALATRGELGSSDSGPGPGSGFVDYFFTVFLVVFVLLIPVAAWMWWLQRNELVFEAQKQKRKERRLANAMTALALFAIALWIGYLRAHGRGFFGQHQLIKPPPSVHKGPKGASTAPEPVFHWWLAGLIFGVVFAGVAVTVVLWRRQRRRMLREASTAAEAVSLALDEALDDLRDGDPREAVIRAYARMETVLGAHGLPRESHEAPFEWLRRILVSLHASALSVERLAELFERAKFSRHTIDEAMREDAIGALTTVRDELRATA